MQWKLRFSGLDLSIKLYISRESGPSVIDEVDYVGSQESVIIAAHGAPFQRGAGRSWAMGDTLDTFGVESKILYEEVEIK